MTDIARHLGGIVQLLRPHTESASDQHSFSDTDWMTIRQQITAFLPGSYGVGSGKLISAQGECSQPLPIVVYDKPLAQDAYTPNSTQFQISHVLLVIDAAFSYTKDSLSDTLARIASVKHLKEDGHPARGKKSSKPPGQVRETIPTYRLPVGLVYCGTLLIDGDHIGEITRLIRTYPMAQLPDYIHFAAQNLLYRNPALDTFHPQPHELGLSLTPALTKPRACYVCKQKFFRPHFFYGKLCIRCADLNYEQRLKNMDLSGMIALVTGARIRIGYAAALKLLRCGAEVIATTRFPHDAARRYAAEADFAEWGHRLHIYGIDLRHTAGLERFVQHLNHTYPQLDILINNAAQTVRRPPAYYAHLLPFERLPLSELPTPLRPLLLANTGEQKNSTEQQALYPLGTLPQPPAELTQIPLVTGDDQWDTALFPPGQYDSVQQQIDNRPENSWTLRLDEVSMPELLEVHLVNAVAPGLLVSGLKPLMLRGKPRFRFIINVSALEGQFAADKLGYHTHTNMAKAALNMLTRSAAPDYAESMIYINSVDPGWVSDQMPHTNDAERATANALLPLDVTDGAARICAPIFAAIQSGQPTYGKLFKDYVETEW